MCMQFHRHNVRRRVSAPIALRPAACLACQLYGKGMLQMCRLASLVSKHFRWHNLRRRALCARTCGKGMSLSEACKSQSTDTMDDTVLVPADEMVCPVSHELTLPSVSADHHAS